MKKRIVELKIDDFDMLSGVDQISLVDEPAIEYNWLAFKKHNHDFHVPDGEDHQFLDALKDKGDNIEDLKKQGWVLTRSEVIGSEQFSDPNATSWEDTDDVRVRYRYGLAPNISGSPIISTTRDFCKAMVNTNRVFRFEDILDLPASPENPGGNAVFYRGGFNCRHYWYKLEYRPEGRIINKASIAKNRITDSPAYGDAGLPQLSTITQKTSNNPKPSTIRNLGLSKENYTLPLFENEQDAIDYSKLLDCEEGAHPHEIGGVTLWMPCTTHPEDIKKESFEPNMPHYTSDGELYEGPTHKHNDRLMTGAVHTEDSEYLYHEDQLGYDVSTIVGYVDQGERRKKRKKDDYAEVGPRGGIKASPKAPKSDTPNPNPKGEGTAKGDASGERGAKVTAAQEKTLQGKVDEFNEKDSNTKNGRAALGALKSVFQRGLGAYNTSRSPAVRSAEQWAYARVNAFLYLLKNGRPENPKYTTDYDLLPNKHPKAKKNMSMIIICPQCGHSWDMEDGGDDVYVCHICDNKYVNVNIKHTPKKEDFESYDDYPKQAQENAKVALRWAEENGWGDCGTPVGKQRANQISNGENISEETIARMASFERHRKNSDKELGDGCGRLMWLAWGGDAGVEWAQRKLEQIRKEEMAELPNNCWEGYEPIGTKIKDGREVPNCVPIKNKKVFSFQEENDQYTVVGPAMIPNKEILRKDDKGKPYFVYFSDETVLQISEKFMKKGYTVDGQHDVNHRGQGEKDVYVTESWIIEDSENDKSNFYGFENLPKGTWMVKMRVYNKDVWKKIKEGELRGFSVSGYFEEYEVENRAASFLNELAKLLQ